MNGSTPNCAARSVGRHLIKDSDKAIVCETCHHIWPVSHDVMDLLGARASSPATKGAKDGVGDASENTGENAYKNADESVCENADESVCEIAGDIARELHPRAEGMLVRARGDQFIYRMESGQRRRIVSDKVFYARGYNLDQVKIVNLAWLHRFPEGPPIT